MIFRKAAKLSIAALILVALSVGAFADLSKEERRAVEARFPDSNDPAKPKTFLVVRKTGIPANPDKTGPLGAYSGPFRPVIPGEAVHPFRGKPTTDSDGKPSTFWGGAGTVGRDAGTGGRNAPESVDGMPESFPPGRVATLDNGR